MAIKYHTLAVSCQLIDIRRLIYTPRSKYRQRSLRYRCEHFILLLKQSNLIKAKYLSCKSSSLLCCVGQLKVSIFIDFEKSV